MTSPADDTPAGEAPDASVSDDADGAAGGRAGGEAGETADAAPAEETTAEAVAEPPAETAAEPDAASPEDVAAGPAPPRPPGAVRRVLTSRRAPRLRTGIAAFLVIAAVLGLTASALALWSRALVFDTDTYVEVVTPVLEDPAVRSSVATYVAAKAADIVDLESRLESALPAAAQMTAPALTRALQQYLTDEVGRFLATDVAQRLWVDVNRFAHRQLVSALKDENRFITVGHDDVTLDLVPLVAVALQKLEDKVPHLLGKDVTLPRIDPSTAPQDIRTLLQDALGREVPADFGTVTLLRGSQGYELKQALRQLDRLVFAVVALTAVLVAAALLVSVHRRRTALWLGLGALLAFAGARVIETQLEKAVVDAVKTTGGAAVARSVLTAAVASLNGFFVWIAVAGAIVVVAALLAGRPAWLRSMGRAFAELFGVASDLPTPDTRAGRWIHGHLDVLRVGGVAVAVVVLLFVTGSWAAVTAVVVALVVYELALTTYAAGLPPEPVEPAPAGAAAGDSARGEEPADESDATG